MRYRDICIVLFLLTTFLISFHLLDIGDITYDSCLTSNYYWKGYYTALNKTYNANDNCYLTNGFWRNEAKKVYHIGMYGMVISFMTLLGYIVYLEYKRTKS